MVLTLTYESISSVIESWELARQRHGFEEKVGNDILQRLFELEPETKLIFGFELKSNTKAPGLESFGVLIHGKRMVAMLDSVFSLLGPDIDTLESILKQLGERHQGYGVKPAYFPLLGQAIREVLSENLGSDWNDDIAQSWTDVFSDLSDSIIRNMPTDYDHARQLRNMSFP